MQTILNEILSDLKNSTSNELNQEINNLHFIPPYISSQKWKQLGDYVCNNEKKLKNIEGKCWYTLRLDGHCFSKTIKKMRELKLIPEKNGFSDIFASLMVECLKKLMIKINAKFGYTQSDEMIVFVSPSNVVRGIQEEHLFNGRIIKLCTLASSYVTSVFVSKLAKLNYNNIDSIIDITPHFDCRIASWDSWDDAYSLLLWRANDCAMNGVTDAVYSYDKKLVKLNRKQKLEWLHHNNLLPLPKHQAYGTIIKKEEREIEGFNPITNRRTTTKRNILLEEQKPILKFN